MTTQQTLRKQLDNVVTQMQMCQIEIDGLQFSTKTYVSVHKEEFIQLLKDLVIKIQNLQTITIADLENIIHDLFRILDYTEKKFIRGNKETYLDVMHFICGSISNICKLRRIMYNEIEMQKYI